MESEYRRVRYTAQPVTDLQVSPKRSPSLLDYTNTYGPRDSCALSVQRNYEPDAVQYGMRGVGTQFMIVTSVGSGCQGKGRHPESFTHLIILDLATRATVQENPVEQSRAVS